MKLSKGAMSLSCTIVRAYKGIIASQWDRSSGRSKNCGFEENRVRNPRAAAMW